MELTQHVHLGGPGKGGANTVSEELGAPGDESKNPTDLAKQDPNYWKDPADAERAKLSGPQTPLLQPAKADDVRTGKPTVHEITHSGAAVAWESPRAQLLSQADGETIAGYTVSYVTLLKGAKPATITVNGSSYTQAYIGNLSPNTAYNVSVITNYAGGEVSSDATVFNTLSSYPSKMVEAPTVSEVEYEDVLLKWTPPKSNGIPITKYILSQAIDTSDFTAVTNSQGAPLEYTPTNEPFFRVSGLSPGTQYRFKVAAVNTIGTGPVSDASTPVKTKLVGVPLASKKVEFDKLGKSKHSLLLNFDAANSRGAEVLQYSFYLKKLVQNVTSNGTRFFTEGVGAFKLASSEPVNTLQTNDDGKSFTHRIENLKVGSGYAVKIEADNRFGRGVQSAAAFDDTVGGVPTPPREVRVLEINSTWVKMKWDAPRQDNGANVVGYRIQQETAGRGGFASIVADTQDVPASDYDPEKRELKVSDLKYGGVAYQWRVFAISSYGVSKPAYSTQIVTAFDRLLDNEKAVAAQFGLDSMDGIVQKNTVCNQKRMKAEVAKRQAETETANCFVARRVARQETLKYKSDVRSAKEQAKSKINACLADARLRIENEKILANKREEAIKKIAREKVLSKEALVQSTTEEVENQRKIVLTKQLKIDKLKEEVHKMRRDGCKLGIEEWCKDPDDSDTD